jgi:hypothetical protein
MMGNGRSGEGLKHARQGETALVFAPGMVRGMAWGMSRARVSFAIVLGGVHAGLVGGLVAGIAFGAAACDRGAPEPAAASARDAGASARAGVAFVEARPDGEVAPLVLDALSEAARERRTVVVYVGATWCEPCQRFHEAARRGELDAEFPSLTLLEFDLDRDRDRLARAGYTAKYIPLFVLPATTGLASDQMLSGGIKGEGAVGFIAPRLKALLER